MSIIETKLPIACGHIDAEGGLIAANKRWHKLFGTDVPVLPRYQPDGRLTRDCFLAYMDYAKKTGESNFEMYAQKTDGTEICVAATLQYEPDGTFVACAHEITEYKAAADAAIERDRQSFELAQRVLDAAPFFIETWDNDMNLIGCNQAAVDIFGLKNKEHYMEVYEKLHPEYQPCGMKTVDKIPLVVGAVMENGYTEGEWMHVDINGDPVPVYSCYVRFKVGDGNMVVGYSRDMRLINAAMNEVRKTLETTKQILDSAPFYVETWDSDKNLIDCNDVAAKIFGFSSMDEYFENYDKLTPKYQPGGEKSTVLLDEYFHRAFDTGYARFEWMHQLPNGEPLPMEVTLVRIEHGGELRVIAYSNDLRPIKKALEQAEAANAMAQEFLDAAPFFVEVWNKDIEMIGCSQAVIRTFGLSGKEEYIKHNDKFSPKYQPCGRLSEDVFRDLINTAFKDGYARAEWTHLDAEGNPWPFDAIYTRLRQGNGDIVVGYARDLREEKLRALAEDASKAKSVFLSTMSHEIRTPMNAIMGITEIQLNKPDLNLGVKDAFEKIYASGDLLLGIINDILDLSKIEAGKLELVVSKYETASFISDTVQLNITRLGSKHIEFDLNIDEHMPAHMIGDELRVKQILNNLLSNAFKYTNEGRVVMSVSARENPENPGELTLILSVEDSGSGMTREQLDR